MCCPGDHRRHENAEQWIACNSTQENANAWSALCRGKSIEKDVQGQQHKAQTDQHTSQVLHEVGAAAALVEQFGRAVYGEFADQALPEAAAHHDATHALPWRLSRPCL